MFFSIFPRTVLKKKCSLEVRDNCLDCVHIGIKGDSFIQFASMRVHELAQNNLLNQEEIPNVTNVNDKSWLSKESLFFLLGPTTDDFEHAKEEVTYL